MLTTEIREALKTELEHYKAQRRELDLKVEALEAILRPSDDLGLFQPELPMNEPHQQSNPRGNGALAGKGLRESIRLILKAYPTGLKASEIAAKMEELGFRPNGKTNTVTLVYGDAHRLARLGKLRKRGKKYLLLPEERTT